MNGTPPRIAIHNHWTQLGLVFYTQRRRGWTRRQLATQILDALDPETPRPEREAPDPGPEMEAGLRSRVYRLARPRYWERIRLCLDREGYYHPEWRGPYQQLGREMRNSGLAVLLEPPPVPADQRPRQQEKQVGSRRTERSRNPTESKEVDKM
jgi:hypothetical protein